MILDSSLTTLFIFALAVIVAVTFHEFAHAFVATRLGDPTPLEKGRLSLNPLKHLDLFGTISLFLVGFGWGKPVPIDRLALKTKTNLLRVALAGPLASFLLAAVFAIPFNISFFSNLNEGSLFFEIISIFIQVNLVLAVFNLIPVPPLDGSKLLYLLIPFLFEKRYPDWEKIGSYLILILVFYQILTGNFIFQTFFSPIMDFLWNLLT